MKNLINGLLIGACVLTTSFAIHKAIERHNDYKKAEMIASVIENIGAEYNWKVDITN